MILLYWALPSEASVSDLMHSHPGHAFALPRVIPGASEVECRRITTQEHLESGAYGIKEPRPDLCPIVDPADIDIAVIPGLAFSLSGQRLGRGGGYYDRLLGRPDFQSLTIGVCYECQIFDQLPTESHDCGVDCVITERGVRWQRNAEPIQQL